MYSVGLFDLMCNSLLTSDLKDSYKTVQRYLGGAWKYAKKCSVPNKCGTNH